MTSMNKINKKTILILLFIALLALFNSLSFIFFRYKLLSSDTIYYDRIAWNFAQGHGLIDQGKPFIYKTPTYVLFVSIIYYLFGHFPILVLIIQSILYSICCVILYLAARNLCDEKTSLLAGLGFAFYFPAAYYSSGILSEILGIFLALLVILFCLKFRKTSEKQYLVFCGIFLGLDILCKPILLFFPVPIILYFFWQRIKKLYIAVCILFISISITMAPWVWRNYLIFHKFIPLSKGYVEEVFIGSVLDYKYSLWDWNFWFDKPDDPRRKDLDLIRKKIDLEFNNDSFVSKENLLFHTTLELIAKNPMRYLQGCFVNIAKLWLSYPSRAVFLVKMIVILFDLILLGFAIIGIIVIRKQWKQFSIFWLPLVYITLIHLPFHVESRFTILVKPYLFIFVSIGINKIFYFLSNNFFKNSFER